MNDNIPAGAQHDSRAPWNDDSQDVFEQAVEQAFEDVLNDVEDAIQDVLYNMVHESSVWAIPPEWEEIISLDKVKEEVHELIDERLKRIYNNEK